MVKLMFALPNPLNSAHRVPAGMGMVMVLLVMLQSDDPMARTLQAPS